jgi:cobalt-zinc-cadmium efflux system outer membrane protein
MFGWQTVDEVGVEVSGPVMGVAWPIPIFDRQQGDRDAANATVAAARASLDLETARVSAELAAASAGYDRLRDAALSAVDSVAIGDNVLASATARFEAGESDVTELLETVRGVISARLAALDLYAAALAAHRELDMLMGRSWSPEEE